MAMCCQIFIPCYFGDAMYIKMSILSDRIYNSNWTVMGPRFNKQIIIMMEFMKKPKEIVAGSLFHLRLTTFTSVIIIFLLNILYK